MTTAPSQQAEADALIRLYAPGEEFTATQFASALGLKPLTAWRLLADAQKRGLVVLEGSKWVRA